jgi:hypothetical protein
MCVPFFFNQPSFSSNFLRHSVPYPVMPPRVKPTKWVLYQGGFRNCFITSQHKWADGGTSKGIVIVNYYVGVVLLKYSLPMLLPDNQSNKTSFASNS